MKDLSDMIWIELRKAIRSDMPLWTALGSLLMPLSVAFLIFISKNPEASQKLGLISAKADLMKYGGAGWSTYLGLSGTMIAGGGLLLFGLVVSWVFGREFEDGTLKDMLAVPVQRSKIVLAKFIVTTLWSFMLIMVTFAACLLMGAILKLPGGSNTVLVQGKVTVVIAAGMTIAVVLPLALLASIGRGYLLPMGGSFLTMLLASVVGITGWDVYVPWAVPGLYAEAKGPLPPASYGVVILTCLAGMIATHLWWKYADQNR